MAQDLLLGIGWVGRMELLGLSGVEWYMRLVTSITEHLFIHRDTAA